MTDATDECSHITDRRMALSSADLAGTTSSAGIGVCVRELTQLFNAIDPSPFAERDLNDETERFIVSWARDLPADAPLTLTVRCACSPATSR